MNRETTMPTLRPPSLHSQRGFSLAELMIAATIGLIIMAGMTTLFVNNTRAQAEVEKANRQVENGRFAIQTLSQDLRNAGFYGEFDPTVLASPAALPDPCAVTVAALKAALPLAVQGIDNAAADALTCLPGLKPNTDVVVVRRTSTCVAGAADCAPVADGGPFFQASLCASPTELGSGDSANFYALDIGTATLNRHKRNCAGTAPPLADVRRFLTYIYYIAANGSGTDGIPTLKRTEVGTSGNALATSTVSLVNGVENLQLEYGLDTSADGVADVFTAAPADVAAWRQVVSIKLNLLARNMDPTAGHSDTRTYRLGRNAAGEAIEIAPGGAYKRHVFQSLVPLPNPAGRRMP
jgi:type IV pilus assembly protein PilW